MVTDDKAMCCAKASLNGEDRLDPLEMGQRGKERLGQIFCCTDEDETRELVFEKQKER